MKRLFEEGGHLLRVAGLFVAGLGVFLLLRGLLIPEGFGLYGHYRAGALEDNRKPPLVYAGRAACSECHDERSAELAQGRHAAIGCESCHGPLARHAEDPEQLAPHELDSTYCVRCHAFSIARPASFPQVDPEAHSGGSPCLDCHAAHAPSL